MEANMPHHLSFLAQADCPEEPALQIRVKLKLFQAAPDPPPFVEPLGGD
jgi:hypothetical protein